MNDDLEAPRTFKPGDTFRQFHYRIERFLGEGGSGQVYAVQHRFTDVVLALKVIHLAQQGNAKEVARSLIEAQASFCIRHDNVVEVIDIGCEDDGLVWQLMELLEGHPLAVLLRRYGRLSPVYAIDIVVEAAHGLQAAHEMGIVHRDVTPSNVFVTSAGRVKVLDFSLASWVRSPLKTTAGRGPKGTLGYMAPEHLRKATPTPLFDVYSLGVVLWQMLVGRHPFSETLDNAITTVQRQLNEEPASLVKAAGLPAYVDEVVRGALARDPAARYPGMWAFAQALLGLRARLLADGALGRRVRQGEPWEHRLPIVRGTESALRYGSSRVPAPAVAPHVPSARVYVAAGVAPAPARPVAPTVPMAAVPEAVPASEARPNRTPPAVTAPLTVRRGGAPWSARWIAVALAAPVLLGIGVGVWVLRGFTVAEPGARPLPAPLPPSTGAAAPARPSAPAVSAPSSDPPRPAAPPLDPRRRTPPRPGR